MKKIYFFVALVLNGFPVPAQHARPSENELKQITRLIDNYSNARDSRDTVLLKKILTTDIDQLVSTGEWRSGKRSAIDGMLKSSAGTPGSRSLTIDKIRLVTPLCAIVDCRYEIKSASAVTRKMWSSFILVSEKTIWKISAIRNMLPTEP